MNGSLAIGAAGDFTQLDSPSNLRKFAGGWAQDTPTTTRLRSMICGLLLVVMSLYPPGAIAQNLPSFAPDAYCQRMAGIGGGFSRDTYGGCLGLERRALDALRSNWISVASSIRARCTRMATVGENGSYSTLQGCIDMELAAPAAPAQAAPPRRFFLMRPPDQNGTAYDSLDDCLAARAKITPEVAVCMYR